MFKWCNNVVATNIADRNIPFVTFCDADFSVNLRKLENFKLLVLCVIPLKLHRNFRSILTVTAMNRLDSRYYFMRFYDQIVTYLLVTCAAAADVGLHVDATACIFQLKFFQWRDHEWTSQTNNGQGGYGVGRSVFWRGD